MSEIKETKINKRLYYIEENKRWFSRVFLREGKRYSLCVEREVMYRADSWCYETLWEKGVIESSNNLKYLQRKLENLRVVNI